MDECSAKQNIWQTLNGVAKQWDDQEGGQEDDQAAAANTSYTAWALLLSKYTTSDLSFPQDKLVALSGLAETRARNTGSEYLAGLWRDRLPRELLWQWVDPAENDTHRPYVAPSWSWASKDGEIRMFNPTSHDEQPVLFPIEILDAWVLLQGESCFGHVKDGSLILEASIARVQCVKIQDSRFSFITSSFSFQAIQSRQTLRGIMSENLLS